MREGVGAGVYLGVDPATDAVLDTDLLDRIIQQVKEMDPPFRPATIPRECCGRPEERYFLAHPGGRGYACEGGILRSVVLCAPCLYHPRHVTAWHWILKRVRKCLHPVKKALPLRKAEKPNP